MTNLRNSWLVSLEEVQHVAGVLRQMLHPKSFTINNCCTVAPFSDLYVDWAVIADLD